MHNHEKTTDTATQIATNAVRIITRQDRRIDLLETALRNLLREINPDKEGGYFIYAEADGVVSYARIALEQDDGFSRS